jgi:murein DD-endopeptidase MepM/ murein hydrolase activator NlpD
MATDSINAMNPLVPDGTSLSTTQKLRSGLTQSPDTDRAQIQSMAQQFESLLLAQMLREMKQSMVPESDEQGLGGSIMGDTFMSELGMALSRAGGVGLSKVLVDGFIKSVGTVPGDSPRGQAPGTGPDGSEIAPLPEIEVSPASVSSTFGWRTDPLDGTQRFHAGTDLRLAYGQDVRAAADGVVTFAGNRGGYGTLVTVRHRDGVETRYAHLSSLDVREGDDVAAGQVIARSGNTGRTTGPHLHFEVRQNGHPVDPAAVDGLISLDELGGDAGH